MPWFTDSEDSGSAIVNNDFLSGHALVISASRNKEKSTYSKILKNFCVGQARIQLHDNT